MCNGGGGTTQVIDFDVVHGSHLGGGIAELSDSDDDEWTGRSAFGFSALEANMHRVNVDFDTTVTSPSNMVITVESRLNNPGGTARMRMLRWFDGQFVEEDMWAIGTTDVVHNTNVSNPGVYINASDRLRMQLQYTVVATFSAVGFDVIIDQTEIDLN